MKISKAIFRQEALGDQQRRVGSKKSIQQGRSHFCARSVLALCEHGINGEKSAGGFFQQTRKWHGEVRGSLRDGSAKRDLESKDIILR